MSDKRRLLAVLLATVSAIHAKGAMAQVAPASLWGLDAISEETGPHNAIAKAEPMPAALPEVAFSNSGPAVAAPEARQLQPPGQRKNIAVASNELWGLEVIEPLPFQTWPQRAEAEVLPETGDDERVALTAPSSVLAQNSEANPAYSPSQAVAPVLVGELAAIEVSGADRQDDKASGALETLSGGSEHPPRARSDVRVALVQQTDKDIPRRRPLTEAAMTVARADEGSIRLAATHQVMVDGKQTSRTAIGQQTSRLVPSWLTRFLEDSLRTVDTDGDGKVGIYSQSVITASATGYNDFATGALSLASQDAKDAALSAAAEEDHEDNPLIAVLHPMIMMGASAHAAASHVQDRHRAIASSSRVTNAAPAQQAKSPRSSPDKQRPGQDPTNRLAFLIPDDWRLRPRKGLFE